MNGRLDIEVFDGKVHSVWFNCQILPFQQWDITAERAAEFDGNVQGRITERIAVEYSPEDNDR